MRWRSVGLLGVGEEKVEATGSKTRFWSELMGNILLKVHGDVNSSVGV